MHILIPAQRFQHSKSRLSQQFDAEERSELSRWMLGRVLRSFAEAAPQSTLHVLSNDVEVLHFAKGFGASASHDRPNIVGHGNQLRAFAAEFPPQESLLVVMSDLPIISRASARTLIEQCHNHRVVLAPDRHRLGTNAAFFRDASCRQLHFGHADSFVRHQQAHQNHCGYACHEAPAFHFDLDELDDLQALRDWQLESDVQDDELTRWLAGSHA